jgi:hypothetical protein
MRIIKNLTAEHTENAENYKESQREYPILTLFLLPLRTPRSLRFIFFFVFSSVFLSAVVNFLWPFVSQEAARAG